MATRSFAAVAETSTPTMPKSQLFSAIKHLAVGLSWKLTTQVSTTSTLNRCKRFAVAFSSTTKHYHTTNLAMKSFAEKSALHCMAKWHTADCSCSASVIRYENISDTFGLTSSRFRAIHQPMPTSGTLTAWRSKRIFGSRTRSSFSGYVCMLIIRLWHGKADLPMRTTRNSIACVRDWSTCVPTPIISARCIPQSVCLTTALSSKIQARLSLVLTRWKRTTCHCHEIRRLSTYSAMQDCLKMPDMALTKSPNGKNSPVAMWLLRLLCCILQ